MGSIVQDLSEMGIFIWDADTYEGSFSDHAAVVQYNVRPRRMVFTASISEPHLLKYRFTVWINTNHC